jgi:regulator of PEP synthase PpsR (kinase-PPPase family)
LDTTSQAIEEISSRIIKAVSTHED